MAKELNEKFWENYFKVYDVLNIVSAYRELVDTICDEAKITKGMKVLDAGSGTGNLAKALSDRGASVIAIDNVQAALKLHKTKDSNANVKLVDLKKKLPFENNIFDRVVINNTLYTIEEEERLNIVRELHRVMKNEGIIVISNPHKEFSPKKIYRHHLKKSINDKGISSTGLDVLRMLSPTLKMFYYNSKIFKNSNKDIRRYLTENEQKNLLREVGFEIMGDKKNVYADQAILHTGIKK